MAAIATKEDRLAVTREGNSGSDLGKKATICVIVWLRGSFISTASEHASLRMASRKDDCKSIICQ
ncbi:hypothetical protein BHM03_00055781, partial [Ensete ventricosum]